MRPAGSTTNSPVPASDTADSWFGAGARDRSDRLGCATGPTRRPGAGLRLLPMPGAHPLREIIAAIGDGRYPVADGGWTRVPRWRPGLDAVVAITGHAYLALPAPPADPSDGELDALGCNGFGGAHHPRVALAIAGEGAEIGVLDMLMVARASGSGPRLVRRDDLAGHPRVLSAGAVRDEVTSWGYPDPARLDVASIGRGIAGLTEIGIEAERPGSGSRLAADVLATLPAGELVLAAVSPGNARSTLSLLRAGFGPIGSVQLITPAG